ncbi:MAG: hypothetical protein K2J65_10405 [Duncaniella sp.]|nr:hypothetical protein [Duncaniella sp.]
MKANTDSMKSSKTPQLPISKKAYADFAARITGTFTGLMLRPDLCDEGIKVLDRYLQGENICQDDCSLEVYIAFSMIRSEIDKACRRSAAARQRAALRKKSSSSCDEDYPEILSLKPVPRDYKNNNGVVDVAIPESAPCSHDAGDDYPMNRRERRELEREEARELRRELRRQKRRK